MFTNLKFTNIIIGSLLVLQSTISLGGQDDPWLTQLRNLELSDSDIQSGRLLNMPPADQAVLERFRFEDINNASGLPSVQDSHSDISHNGYSTGEYLQQLLKSVGEYRNGQFTFTKDLGPGIEHLYNTAIDWVDSSGESVNQVLPRIMLNRCVDFFQLMFPVAGRNTDEVRRFFANYWVACYTNAIAYANNHLMVSNNEHLQDLPLRLQNFVGAYAKLSEKIQIPVHMKSMALFGYEQAEFFYKNTAGQLAEESQAVGLIRLLGYLGHDSNADMRRRLPNIVKTMTDIRNIQRSPEYRGLIKALENAQPFNPQQKRAIRGLRVQVSRLLKALPSRLVGLDDLQGSQSQLK